VDNIVQWSEKVKGEQGGIMFELIIKQYTKKEKGADHGEMSSRAFKNIGDRMV
jgi:hypothetical protein